ncbi:MAG: heavy metal translocating P-type ATPase [Clostridia bacterium]|nr:heavy metal translocating P-type ATPase [Clostridia bacterium]
MKQYKVTGMSCAACSARVEKAVSTVPGVTSCAVNLLTNSMNVEGTASDSSIIKAVVDAGYGASPKNSSVEQAPSNNFDDTLKDEETPKLIKRLIASVILLIPLMYESMGHMLWNWPLPTFLNNNHIGMGLYELVLATAIIVINQRFFISGFKGLIHRAPNMDTLVSLGATAAYCYSLVSLFAMSYYSSIGDNAHAASFMNEFYFESAATILTLITVGKTLEAKSKGKTTNALKSLINLAPKKAVILKDNSEIEVTIEEVKVGDHFVVKPGENIPVDGIVIEGISAVNEASLTGESIPVDKKIGDTVSAATINTTGHLVCEATHVGNDTALAKIIQMVSDASATKAPIAKIADKVSGIFVPTVLAIAAVTLVIWLIVGKDVGFALARSISVLVISCPCALGLATPVAIMVGNGKAAKNGILFKTAVALEETGRIQIVALDKTGTITTGEPVVKQIIPSQGSTESELLRCAYAIEHKSEHPLAKAIVTLAEAKDIPLSPVANFKAEAGNGLIGTFEGKTLVGGKLEFIKLFTTIDEATLNSYRELASQGMTPLFFAWGSKFLGIIAVADAIKEDSKAAISELSNMGIHVVMLTGDNVQTANAIGKEVGVHEVVSNVLPDGKEEVITELQKHGKVMMVGDGINDAPALTKANIGVAIGAGTDIAIDAADIVLMKSNLTDVVASIRASKATLRVIHQNLFWAFFYNVCGIPLAAGLWIPILGWTLNPMFGATAMGLSSFCVVSNALRINLAKIYNSSRDKKIKNSVGLEPLLTQYIQKKEAQKLMEIKVNGMMCGHCEAHVRKALEAIDGITAAIPNHETGIVSIKTDKDVDINVIKAAIVDAGYEFVG